MILIRSLGKRFLWICNIHCVSKTCRLWFTITLTHVNRFWYFCGKCITNKVSNQKRFTMPLQITCASALHSKTAKHENRIFFTQMLYQCIARIELVPPWFLQSFWLTTHTHAAVWLPKSCNQCVQLGCWGHGLWERKSRAPQQLDCVARTMHVHQRTVFLKGKKCHLWCVWCRLTFVQLVRYLINTVHWFSLQAWRKTTPIFYTATDTVRDLVNIQRVGNRQQDVMLSFYGRF